MDPLGSGVVRLTSFAKYEWEPAWSYDNKRIAMVRPRLDASNVEHYDIYLMNADGTNKRWARPLPSWFGIRFPSWSPDGSHLVVSVFAGRPVPGHSEGGHRRAGLRHGRRPGARHSAVVRSDGQKIIYVGSSGNTVDQILNGLHTV